MIDRCEGRNCTVSKTRLIFELHSYVPNTSKIFLFPYGRCLFFFLVNLL
jgi:hypothetical protein